MKTTMLMLAMALNFAAVAATRAETSCGDAAVLMGHYKTAVFTTERGARGRLAAVTMPVTECLSREGVFEPLPELRGKFRPFVETLSALRRVYFGLPTDEDIAERVRLWRDRR